MMDNTFLDTLSRNFEPWAGITTQFVIASIALVVGYEILCAILRRLFRGTDSNEQGMQLRVLVSAGDSSKAWDLRCAVREGQIAFLQRDYPQHLPRRRVDLTQGGEEKP